MTDWIVTVRGKTSEWSAYVTESQAKAMREDGLEVFEVVNTIPAIIATLGLSRPWCFLQDVWNLPTKGWRK